MTSMFPSTTDDTIEVPVPFAIPLIGLNEPTVISIDKERFKLFVRIIVVICTGFLFWPKLRTGLGISSRNMEAEQREIQERIAKIEHERELRTNKAEAATTTKTATPVKAKSTEGSGSAKRRKA